MHAASAALNRFADGLGRHGGWFKVGLLALWVVLTFGLSFYARDITWVVAGWPVNFWFAAQGSVLVFIAIISFFAWRMNRRGLDTDQAPDPRIYAAYKRGLHRKFGTYVLCLLCFMGLLALTERWGLSKAWVGGGPKGLYRRRRRSHQGRRLSGRPVAARWQSPSPGSAKWTQCPGRTAIAQSPGGRWGPGRKCPRTCPGACRPRWPW